MHHEINDSRAKWVDKLTDKSPTIKCKIIHWKMRKSGKADKGGWILATASLKVQNLPRRRHFLTQSTEVDEQNSLISWKITSRHDFEEFHNQMEEKHGGLDPESGLGGSKVPCCCWARFLSSPGAMFGFLLGATIFRWSWSTLAFGWSIHSDKEARERERVCSSKVISGTAATLALAQWRTWRWNPQHTPWNPCVCRRAAGERGTLESLKAPHEEVWGRRNELEPERCPPRPLDMSRSTSGAGLPQDQDETPPRCLRKGSRLLRFPIYSFPLIWHGQR